MSEKAKSQWDIVRFLTTLNTFGEVPFLGSFRWVQEWLGVRKTFPGKALNAMKKKVGIVGNLSESSLTALQQALPAVELSSFLIDDTTWAGHNQLMRGFDTLLIWKAPDFSTLVTRLSSSLSINSEVVSQPVFNFTQASADLAAWGALDDVVMGGTSKSAFLLTTSHQAKSSTDKQTAESLNQYGLFAGIVSTENSGGFSSVRTQNFEPAFNFSNWTGLHLSVKGDGQRYKFILRNSAAWDSPAYIYGFDTIADTWITVTVPFAEMVPTFRAKSVPNASPFDPQKTISFQLMLSKFEYDRQLNPHFKPGPFELAITGIEAYRDRKGVPVVVVGDDVKETRERQQAMLAESGIHYRFIEPNSQNIVEAISAALT